MLLTSLLLTAAAMGLAGSPHCLAMCGAATAGVARACTPPGGHAGGALAAWLLGRSASYAALGALLGGGTQILGWAAGAAPIIQPVWVMFHVAVLVLGLALAWAGRQPRWFDDAVYRVTARWRSRQGAATASRPMAGAALAGVFWGALPCGLLYSALMIAALAGGAVQGAAVMLAFALSSGLVLVLGPIAWAWWRQRGAALAVQGADAGGGHWQPVQGPGRGTGQAMAASTGDARWAVRLAGAALAAASGWALWHGVGGGELAPWC